MPAMVGNACYGVGHEVPLLWRLLRLLRRLKSRFVGVLRGSAQAKPKFKKVAVVEFVLLESRLDRPTYMIYRIDARQRPAS
jgi:hypothetical protein